MVSENITTITSINENSLMPPTWEILASVEARVNIFAMQEDTSIKVESHFDLIKLSLQWLQYDPEIKEGLSVYEFYDLGDAGEWFRIKREEDVVTFAIQSAPIMHRKNISNTISLQNLVNLIREVKKYPQSSL